MRYLLLLLFSAGAQATSLNCEFVDNSKNGINILLKGTITAQNKLTIKSLEYADDEGDLLGNYDGTEPVETKNGELIFKSLIADDDPDYGKIYTLYLPTNFREQKSTAATLELGGWSRGNEYGGSLLSGNCIVK